MTRQPVTRQHALDVIAAHRDELRTRFHVTYLGPFGSVARDEATAESDVDLVVEFDPAFDEAIGLLDVARLKLYLEAALGVGKVDLVERETVQPRLRDIILGEAIRAA